MSNWISFDLDTVTNFDHVGRFDVTGVEQDEITFYMSDMQTVLKKVVYSSKEVAWKKYRSLKQTLSAPYSEFSIKE